MALPLGLGLAGGLKALAGSKGVQLALAAGTLLPFLGGRKGAASKAAAKAAVEKLKRGELASLGTQLGIKDIGMKKNAALREEIMDELVKQQLPSTTRLGTIQGTGTGSALARSTVLGAGIFEGIRGLQGEEDALDIERLAQSADMASQLGLMEQDLARLDFAEGVGRSFMDRAQDAQSELASLLSPADLYSISTAAAADQVAQQGMGMAMQGMAGVPRV